MKFTDSAFLTRIGLETMPIFEAPQNSTAKGVGANRYFAIEASSKGGVDCRTTRSAQFPLLYFFASSPKDHRFAQNAPASKGQNVLPIWLWDHRPKTLTSQVSRNPFPLGKAEAYNKEEQHLRGKGAQQGCLPMVWAKRFLG